MTGVIVTSSSCSGTCLTLSMPRQPKVSAADSALARGGRGGGRERLADAVVGGLRSWPRRGGRSCGVLLGRVVRRLARPGGRSAPGTPRRGSAGRARSPRCRRPARASSATASAAAVGVGARRRQRRRVGLEVHGAELARRAPARPRAAARGRAAARAARPSPTDALSCPGVPSAITLPWSMTAMPSASWSASSRYWVQSRIVVPAGDQRADDVPDLVARARVEAGGGLVEEHQLAA